MDDWTPEMDEAFNEIEKQSNLGKQILKKIERDWRKNVSAYERGFIDGMQKQMQSNVDKAVNAIIQRKWVGLTDEEIDYCVKLKNPEAIVEEVEAKLRSKNT